MTIFLYGPHVVTAMAETMWNTTLKFAFQLSKHQTQKHGKSSRV